MDEPTSIIPEEHYRYYYRSMFPLESIKKWVSYGDEELVGNRECTFVFNGGVFNRYRSIDYLTTILESLTTSPPERIEIGSIYKSSLKDRNPSNFIVAQRELVFDIDSDDFKDIKCCCGNSEICEKCWTFMACSLQCLTDILKKNFGFQDILMVFSGRRGAHIWVCDKKARELNIATRKSIVQYLNLNLLVNSNHFTIKSSPLVQQMIPQCEKYFPKIAEDQHIFTNPKILKKIENIFVHDSNILSQIIEIWTANINQNKSPAEKLQIIKDIRISKCKKFCETNLYHQLIITFTFPRLDVNVTIGINHLLKSPFSIHPQSGYLSLPIPEEKIEEFPPNWVPKIENLLDKDVKSLNVYNNSIHFFDDFISKCIQ